MKREDLEKLSLTKEQIDSVMGINGQDIETHKATVTSLTAERDTFKSQLDDANKQISGFEGMTTEKVNAAVTEWQTKLTDAEKVATENLHKVKFNHALESALNGVKAKNTKAVTALLSTDQLKLKDDGTIDGLTDQLTKIKAENDYLFESETKPPVIIKGGKSQSVVGDKTVDAARKAAGLETPAQ